MSATSGPTSPTPFASYDRGSSSWRTSSATFDWDSMPSSVTLPKSGSMRSGRLYARPMSGPATSAPASSSLLPTPSAINPNDGEDPAGWLARREAVKAKGINGNGFGTPLSMAIRMLPTPVTDPVSGNGHARSLAGELKTLPTPTAGDSRWGANGNQPGPDYHTTLTDAIVKMLPTPRGVDGLSGPDYARDEREDSGGSDLVTTVARLLPTPMARLGDDKGRGAQASRYLDQRRSYELDDAIAWMDERTRLLPTPTAQDGANTGGPSQAERNTPPLNSLARSVSTGETSPPLSPATPASLVEALRHQPTSEDDSRLDLWSGCRCSNPDGSPTS